MWPDVGLETQEHDVAVQVRLGNLRAQLLFVPFVTGEHGSEQRDFDLSAFGAEHGCCAENEVWSLPR